MITYLSPNMQGFFQKHLATQLRDKNNPLIFFIHLLECFDLIYNISLLSVGDSSC